MTILSNGTIVTDIDNASDNHAPHHPGLLRPPRRNLARPRHLLHRLGRPRHHRSRPALLKMSDQPGPHGPGYPVVHTEIRGGTCAGTVARNRQQGRAASVADPKRSAPAATRPRPVACPSERAGQGLLSCECDDHCDSRNCAGDADLCKEVLTLDCKVRRSRKEQYDAQHQPCDHGWQLEMASKAGHGITQTHLLPEQSLVSPGHSFNSGAITHLLLIPTRPLEKITGKHWALGSLTLLNGRTWLAAIHAARPFEKSIAR